MRQDDTLHTDLRFVSAPSYDLHCCFILFLGRERERELLYHVIFINGTISVYYLSYSFMIRGIRCSFPFSLLGSLWFLCVKMERQESANKIENVSECVLLYRIKVDVRMDTRMVEMLGPGLGLCFRVDLGRLN